MYKNLLCKRYTSILAGWDFEAQPESCSSDAYFLQILLELGGLLGPKLL